jgi:hypothetical protein
MNLFYLLIGERRSQNCLIDTGKGEIEFFTGRGEERARVAFQLWEWVELS